MNIDKYDPKYCKMLIKHMELGKSYDSFPLVIYKQDQKYVGLSTMYDWEKRIPEWKEAKELAVCACLDFLETRLSVKVSGQEIKGIKAKDIDSYCLMGALARRFSNIYSDKQQVEHSGNAINPNGVLEIKIIK